MILIEVYRFSGEHAITELRELVTGLSLFGHELVLWFAQPALQRQFEDAEWLEVRHLLDTVSLSGCELGSAEKHLLDARAAHRFCFGLVSPPVKTFS